MNERLRLRSFGPIHNIDIEFRAITIIIGDQGKGKSCIAKLFSSFRWLEKQLVLGREKEDYYCKYNRLQTRLFAYHRIEAFVKDDTYILYEGECYIFEYKEKIFTVTKKDNARGGLAKICYVPAERSILSVAENRPKLLKELPDSATDFYDMFCEAKKHLKDGYDLPFGHLHYTYDQLNDISRISVIGEAESQVKLSHASSGIQSALPLCLVSTDLTNLVKNKTEKRLSLEEKARMERQIAEILENTDTTETVRKIMLKRLSANSRYEAFVNIAEEPEISLFPKSQYDLVLSLVRDCLTCDKNMLVMTTHSPYILAVINLLIVAAKVWKQCDEGQRAAIDEVIPQECGIPAEKINAYVVSLEDGAENLRPLINPTTGMIANNDLDSVSAEITEKFNSLYRCYGVK